jgi:hypothetical protein
MTTLKLNFDRMKKTILITLTLATTFLLGFAFKSVTTKNYENKMKRVTGIGGVFLNAKTQTQLRNGIKLTLG